MAFDSTSLLYLKAKKMLDDYVASGGDVDSLTKGHPIYDYIKNMKVVDNYGKKIDLATRFVMLKHPRKTKHSNNIKADLIYAINEYRANGGTFHISRKKLPFYEKLNTYTKFLKKTNPTITHEQVMKSLGFNEFSDIYYRCIKLKNLKDYRDENGFVDSYRNDPKMKAYLQDLSKTLKIPYYLIITLLCDEKLKRCSIFTEYVEHVKQQLTNHISKYGTLKGLSVKNPQLYEKFNTLTKYYSDGTEIKYTKEDWLYFFDLQDVEHGFKETKSSHINTNKIMLELKEKYHKKPIRLKDLDKKTYFQILHKAIKLGISVSELLAMFDLKCNSINIDRLSKLYTNNIPYLNEMISLRDELMKDEDLQSLCEEEYFEHKVKICKVVYERYKNKIYNFIPDTEYEEQL